MSTTLTHPKKILLLKWISSIVIVSVIFMFVVFFAIDMNQCVVSDFDPVAPTLYPAASFTKKQACIKALATCHFFTKAGQCRIKN